MNTRTDNLSESSKRAVIEFETSLKLHIEAVYETGLKLGVDSFQLDVHDLSKYSDEEFMGYALHFHGGGAPDKFARAFLHHIHCNQHHWQHWIFSDGCTPKGSNVVDGVVRMPERYALEMIADRMAVLKLSDRDLWTWGEWMSKIRVHPKTAHYLYEVLDGLGYADVLSLAQFKTF